MRRNEYLPEGAGPLFPENQTLAVLQEAMERDNAARNMTDTAEQVFRLIRTLRR